MNAPGTTLDAGLGPALLGLARAAIGEEWEPIEFHPPELTALNRPGAAFVTLFLDGELRGCIGTMKAFRPLAEDVADNARAAAFRDPRFCPLSRAEFARLRLEVSVLSPLEPLPAADRAAAVRSLVPHVDGVMLEEGPIRATYLPQVWEQIPEPERFLASLCAKAGLPADYWSPGLRLYRYTVEKFEEGES